MFKKLEDVEKKFEKLAQDLQAPGVTDNQKLYRNLMKEYASLEKVVKEFRRFKEISKNITENVALLDTEKDEEMRKLIKADLNELEKERTGSEQELKVLLLPKDPNDER